MRGEDGFSLIEALVALLILGIASVGLVRAAEAHIDSIGALETRAAADWVAANRLVELALPTSVPSGPVEMLGRRFDVSVEERGTDDPALKAVTISVTANGARVAALDGFVDRGEADR